MHFMEIPKTSILIVEDDKFLRTLLVARLKEEGYAVTEAEDGATALKVLSALEPHLIVLDLLMPDIDGFEVLRRMKENPVLAKVPTIVLSNMGSVDDMNRAKALGVVEYLIKANHTLDDILAKIQEVLRKTYF